MSVSKMAEMTAQEALKILGGTEKQPQSEQELITSILAGMTRGEKCFVLLWDSERVQIAALIQQQAAAIAKKDKSIQLAALKLAETDRCCPDCATEGACEYNSPLTQHCYENWLAWLEKEAEGVE